MTDATRQFAHVVEDVTDNETAAAILVLADSVASVARSIQRLGNADASTPMGGLEALGAVLKESVDGLAGAIERRVPA